MIDPDVYRAALRSEGHEPPIPVELMDGIYRNYERRKARSGAFDFEDMLALAVRMLDTYPEAAAMVRDRYAAFTVDEFQDVNPLQAALLDRWLGGRDELCVVGDDYQTIFAFTGASPSHLLTFTDRYPGAKVVRLEENYRSTPEILALANRLAPKLGGFHKELRATRPERPRPGGPRVPVGERRGRMDRRAGAAGARARRRVGRGRDPHPDQRSHRALRRGVRQPGHARTRCERARSCSVRQPGPCSHDSDGPVTVPSRRWSSA